MFLGKNTVAFTCRNKETELRKLMFLLHFTKSLKRKHSQTPLLPGPCFPTQLAWKPHDVQRII